MCHCHFQLPVKIEYNKNICILEEMTNLLGRLIHVDRRERKRTLCGCFLNQSVFQLIFILIFLIILSSTPSSTSAQRSRYSKNYASCYSDTDCDYSRTFLRCHNRECRCSHIHHFDEETNRCLIRVGGSCVVGSRDQFCVAYATCHARSKGVNTGECRCRSRYWENIEGLCVSGAGLRKTSQVTWIPVAVILINAVRLIVRH